MQSNFPLLSSKDNFNPTPFLFGMGGIYNLFGTKPSPHQVHALSISQDQRERDIYPFQSTTTWPFLKNARAHKSQYLDKAFLD